MYIFPSFCILYILVKHTKTQVYIKYHLQKIHSNTSYATHKKQKTIGRSDSSNLSKFLSTHVCLRWGVDQSA